MFHFVLGGIISKATRGKSGVRWKEALRAVLDDELIDVYYIGDLSRFAQYVEELSDLAHWIDSIDALIIATALTDGNCRYLLTKDSHMFGVSDRTREISKGRLTIVDSLPSPT